MSSWAKPGVKCVCIDDIPVSGHVWRDDKPVLRQTYTINRVWVNDDGTIVVNFVELKRNRAAEVYWGKPVGYAAWRFRPLVKPKTEAEDVAMFKRLLDAPVDA